MRGAERWREYALINLLQIAASFAGGPLFVEQLHLSDSRTIQVVFHDGDTATGRGHDICRCYKVEELCDAIVSKFKARLREIVTRGPLVSAYAVNLEVGKTTERHVVAMHLNDNPQEVATSFCAEHRIAKCDRVAQMVAASIPSPHVPTVIFEAAMRVEEGVCIGGAPVVLHEGQIPEQRAEFYCTLYQPVQGCPDLLKTLRAANVSYYAAQKVPGGRGLQWLTSPVESDNFMENYWQQKPLYVERTTTRHYYDHLTRIEDLEPIIRQAQLNNSDQSVLIVKQSFASTDAPQDFAVAYVNGFSLVVHTVEVFWKPIAVFCRSLWDDFLYPSVNIYLTPPSGVAFPIHTDSQDTFILQIAGEKHWQIFQPPILHPYKEEMLGKTAEAPLDASTLGPPLLDILVRPGDLIYIPRGFPHVAATTPGEMGLHLTLTIPTHAYSWGKILTEAIEDVLEENPAFRGAFPVAELMWDERGNEKTEAQFQEQLTTLMERISMQSSASKFLAKFHWFHDKYHALMAPSEFPDPNRTVGDVNPSVSLATRIERAAPLEWAHCLEYFHRSAELPGISMASAIPLIEAMPTMWLVRDLPGYDSFGQLCVAKFLLLHNCIRVV